MFTDVKSAYISSCLDGVCSHAEMRLTLSDLFREEVVTDRMKTAKSFVEARCSFAHIEVIKIWPSAPCSDLNHRNVRIESVPAVLCCWDGQVGCHVEDISAVQRTFLNCFGHDGAQESDDRTRVVAANHSAA